MNIGAAAQAADLPVKTVRYYAGISLVTPHERASNTYRRYDETLIRKLIFVRRARGFGFSIDQCRELLELYEDQTRASADVKRIASMRLIEINAKMAEMQALQRDLTRLVTACQGALVRIAQFWRIWRNLNHNDTPSPWVRQPAGPFCSYNIDYELPYRFKAMQEFIHNPCRHEA